MDRKIVYLGGYLPHGLFRSSKGYLVQRTYQERKPSAVLNRWWVKNMVTMTKNIAAWILRED